MGFRAGAYAKIWKLEKGNGNFYVADMSTNKKVKDRDGNVVQENGKDKYEKDWANKFVRLVGTAAKQAENLSDGASVKIDSCEVTNNYVKEKNTTYTNYVIFAFADENNQSATNTKSTNTSSDSFMDIPDGVDDELPFN